MFITHHCHECGYYGEVDTSVRKVTCPSCGVINDWWIEGEEAPANHRVSVVEVETNIA